jgi:hypothetical protein
MLASLGRIVAAAVERVTEISTLGEANGNALFR